MQPDLQMTGLDKRRVLGSRLDYGDQGRVGADLYIGNEKMAQIRLEPDQCSRGTMRGHGSRGAHKDGTRSLDCSVPKGP